MRSNINILYFGSSKGIGLTEHLTEYAIALKKQGINITVVHTGKEQRNGLIENLDKNNVRSLVIQNIESWKSIFNVSKLSKTIDDEKIDIIHCQGIHHLVFSAISKKFSKNKPRIITYVHAYANQRWYSKLFLFFTNPILNESSDLIFAVSKQTKDILVENGLDERKTIVIHNALNIDKINEHLGEIPGGSYTDVVTKIKDNKSVMFASAKLTPKKGHIILMFAAKKVIEQFPDVRFIVTGIGDFKNELAKITKELCIENNILFVGRIDYPSTIKLMEYSNMGVVPSYAETFCHALIEPMIVGTPVVSTPVGVAEEIIIDGETGYLVPVGDSEKLADKIIYLLQNEVLAKQIGCSGKKVIEHNFNIDVISKQIVAVYHQLLKC